MGMDHEKCAPPPASLFLSGGWEKFPKALSFVFWCWLAVLFVIHAGLLAHSAYVHSPTLNEPGHLAGGIYHWQFGRFDLDSVNPPLVRMAAALPVLAVGVKTNWESYCKGPGQRSEAAVGFDLVAANGERSFWLFTIARWVCIPFSLIGLAVCFLWARDLYGDRAGLLAATLWCFCPNILAHASLMTADVAATALGLSACYLYWRWLKRPSWGGVIAAGAVLGAAELTKFTLILFYPLWLLLWAIYRIPDRTTMRLRNWSGQCAMLLVALAFSGYLVNLGYAFEGSFARLGDFQFVSPALTGKPCGEVGNRFAESWLAVLPVPVPKNYVQGIDLQRRDFESGRMSYLNGEFRRTGGWWYYYLYGLAIKTPLGVLVLLALTVALKFSGWLRNKASWRDEAVLLLSAFAILVFVSSQTGFSEHVRYILPVLPFVFIWMGQTANCVGDLAIQRSNDGSCWSGSCTAAPDRADTAGMQYPGQRSTPWKHRLAAVAVAVCLLWAIASSLSVYPHSLSYFNEFAGGPEGGPRHLLNSNVDWGQDLLYLKDWMTNHPEARPLHLAYFGGIDPARVGFADALPVCCPKTESGKTSDRGLSPGWYAVSVNLLHGWPRRVMDSALRYPICGDRKVVNFLDEEPVARMGWSIFVYQVL